MTTKKETSDDAEERPLSERIDVPQQRIIDEVKAFESENAALKKRLAEDKAFLAEVESFLRWWHDLRAGSSITFDTEAFRVKLAKWLASQEESK